MNNEQIMNEEEVAKVEKIESGHPLSQSADLVQQNIEMLKKLFPTIVKEGKVDLEELKAVLGEEVETREEYYRFDWAGKSEARREANKPSTATLRFVKEESKNPESTGNIFIEGDNLEVLKLLQKSYANQIKMIYIDPPYNTGKDFVYKDNYVDNLGNYLALTGQTDTEGKKVGTNSESEGRYHSNWLNMMYPRIKLAHRLLKEDGFIFISIDNHEVDNLKKLTNEIFGEDNFLGCIVRTTGQTTGQDSDGLGSSFDYLLVYSKVPGVSLGGLPLTEHDKKRFNNEDEKGKFAYDQMRKTGSNDRRVDRPNMYYPVLDPEGNEVFPIGPGGYESCWRFEESTYNKLVADGIILWKKTTKENKEVWWPYVKYYLEGRTKRPSPLWDEIEGNKKASRDLRSLFDGKKIFDFPKPLELLKRIITISCCKEDFILDFFAGSGSTAHAVMQLNAEDGGNRKFIGVQLPELTYEPEISKEGKYVKDPATGFPKVKKDSEARKAGFYTISEITKERIRRAGDKIKAEADPEIAEKLDVGFKAFKLDSSNIRAWEGNPANLDKDLFTAQNNIKGKADGRSDEDLLYEILLKNGLEHSLTLPLEEREINEKTVYNVGFGALFVCLADGIGTAVAAGIGEWKNELEVERCTVIYKDSGFNAVEKVNALQTLKRYGINEVNTI